MTTHKNIVSNVVQIPALFPTMSPGTSKIYGILPFYHIYVSRLDRIFRILISPRLKGCVVLLNYIFSRGVAVVIGPRFDPVSFCSNIERYKITAAMIVPPILVVLAHHPCA